MWVAVVAGLSGVGLVVMLPIALYLAALALAARPARLRPLYGSARRRFCVVVPAHNEAAGIAATVRNLLQVDYPSALRHVVVVADNCVDETARRAAEAGAEVWERESATQRGKGYALRFAFERVVASEQFDAVVVVDADTVVSPNLLRAFDHRLALGAQALQAEYGVLNAAASWRTQLMAVALSLFHRLRSLARERFALSAGLRGNGMCFSTALLRAQPHHSYGLVEDVEFGISLGRRGQRVAFVEEAVVLSEMVSHGAAAVSQRQRWEGGRWQLARQLLPGLLWEAVRRRDAVLADLALDLLVPPLSYVCVGVASGAVLEGVYAGLTGRAGAGLIGWGAAAAAVLLYVARGVMVCGLGWRGVYALLWAPVYVVWKLVLARPFRAAGRAWIRTRRESEVG